MGQVCDDAGRVAGQPNLFVVDGALIPGSSTCVNPAIAERCLDRLLAPTSGPTDGRQSVTTPVKDISDVVPWFGPICRSIPEVAETFRVRDGVATIKEFRPLNLVVQGEQAVVKATGQEFAIEFASWMTIRGSKIVRWRSYCDPSPVIAAFKGIAEATLQPPGPHPPPRQSATKSSGLP